MRNMTLSERLKASTEQEHRETEKLLIEKIKSIQSKDDYIGILKIFYGYFAPIEQLIRQFLTAEHLNDLHERRNVSRIKEDLNALGYNQDIPLSRVLPSIENYCHAAGAMYVQEGSTLGGRHIAKMISTKVADATDALSFFNGYNEKTDEMWNSFKGFINTRFTTESEASLLVGGAKQTFVKMKDWILLN
jgi:heme oxygenase